MKQPQSDPDNTPTDTYYVVFDGERVVKDWMKQSGRIGERANRTAIAAWEQRGWRWEEHPREVAATMMPADVWAESREPFSK